ncbi:MAG: insulinase family protein [Oscillospiraceae bacterium]|nr:insulinase family protein [Oscillospiraceae bacterium]
MKEITKDLCEGVQLTCITEPKFKTSDIAVVMLMPAEPEHYAKWSLAHSILLNSCKKYPSVAEMSKKLQELYGSHINGSIFVSGDVFHMNFTISAIADSYALNGEKLRQEVTEFLLECLLHPLLNSDNNAFTEQAFQTELQDLLDMIGGEINDKRSYASKRLKEIAFAGEIASYTCYGTKEEALALTPEIVYQAYLEFLEKAKILIYYVGSENALELENLFLNAFKPRKLQDLGFYATSACKSEPVVVRESMNVNQCQLMLALKSNQNPTAEQLHMTSLMLGGAPFSLLFSNVREKLSLCYYCSSKNIRPKNSIVISSGVSAENLETTQKAILEQLELLQKGEFDDMLLINAKRYIINALRLTGDTPSSCVAEALERFIREDHASVEERIALFEQVTKEDIIATANTLQLDSVYILEQEATA